MNLEITPEPTAEERAAIVAALAQELEEDESEPQAVQGFLMKRKDSARP